MKVLKQFKILSMVISFTVIIQSSIMIFAEQDIKVSSNNFQSYIISNDKVYSFGNGELGLGESYSNLTAPKEIEELSGKGIVSVSSGLDFSVALCSDGKVYGWGYNKYGQLCNEDFSAYYPKPVEIAKLADKHITKLSASDKHVLALTEDKKVYSWGCGELGQRGSMSQSNSPLPTEISSLSDKGIIEISTGKNHCLALSSDGMVYVWGANNCGQLGLGDAERSTASYQPYPDTGKKFIYDYKSKVIPIELKYLSDKKVIHIFAGGDSSFALCSDGKAYGWGDHKFGQLGIGVDSKTEWIDESILYTIRKRTVFELADNGVNLEGVTCFNKPQLIKELTDKKIVEIASNVKSSLFLPEDGKLFGSGLGIDDLRKNQYSPKVIESLTDKKVIGITKGGLHSLAVTEDGSAYVWGFYLNTEDDRKLTKVFEYKPEPVLTFSTNEIILDKGKNMQIGYSINPPVENAKIEWTSDKLDVVTVDANGVVSAKSVGEAVVKANINGYNAFAEMKVKVPEAKQDTIIKSDITKIMINNKLLETDTPPVIIEDRTLVPIRAIFEALDAKVEWDNDTQTVTGTKDSLIVKLQIDNKHAYLNDKEIELDVPAMIINDRTLVPVRFISESVGATVTYDEGTNTVYITK